MRAFAKFVAAVCAAAAPLAQAHAQDDWAAVVDAARREGVVVVYNAGLGVQLYAEIARRFTEKYGIRVETINGRGSEMTERIRSEHAGHRYVGDVECHSATNLATQTLQGGYLQPHGGVPNMAHLRAPFVARPSQIPMYVQAYGMLVNTALVKEGEAPRAWKDLLDPKWKGRILQDDPRPSGAGQGLFGVLLKTYGREFLEKLAAQNPVFDRDSANDVRRVARGEFALFTPLTYGLASDLKGLPVRPIVPEDGSPYSTIDFGTLTNAPHPNAARLFINYFLEADSQLVYANGWMPPVVAGVVERSSAEAKLFASARLLGTTYPEEREALTRAAAEIFK
jgi:ABC-type Fe3+ transport system substrate-binding protein